MGRIEAHLLDYEQLYRRSIKGFPSRTPDLKSCLPTFTCEKVDMQKLIKLVPIEGLIARELDRCSGQPQAMYKVALNQVCCMWTIGGEACYMQIACTQWQAQ